jgi:ABC-type lipoprotein release transport system permease subunit
MIAIIAALLVAIFILALALSKPVLFGMGIGYTKQRPKQTAFVIAGLMVTTTVVAGAGILADSAAESFAGTEDNRWENYDAYSRYNIGEGDSWDSVFAQRSVQEVLAFAHPYKDTQAFVYDDSKLGETLQMLLLSAPARERLGIELTENEMLVPSRFASGGDLGVGSDLHFDGVAAGTTNTLSDQITGSITAVEGPAGWVIAPNSNNVRTISLPAGAGQFSIFTSHSEYELDLESPTGVTYSFTDQQEISWSAEVEPEGDWTATVRMEGADVQFSFSFYLELSTVQSLGDWSGKIAQIGALQTPLYGERAVLALEGFEEGPVSYFFKFKGGVNPEVGGAIIESAARAANIPVSIDTKLANPDQEQALLRFAANLMFLSMGGLSVISGIILIAVLMGLLVEERKRALGTMRALGATRGNLTFMHVSEGTLYATIAGAFGIIGGLLMAIFLLDAVQTIVDDTEVVRLSAKPMAYLGAGVGSALLILSVIAFSAYRVTKIDIATAIRGEEQDLRHGRKRAKKWAIIWTALGVIFLLLGIITGAGTSVEGDYYVDQVAPGLALGLTLAVALFGLGVAPLFGKYVGKGAALTAVSLGVLLFTVLSFQFLEIRTGWDGLSVLVRMIMIPITFGILVAYSRPLHEGIVHIATKFGGVAALWDAALSSIRNRPGRNAMTIAVLGSVLMGITAMGALFETFSVTNADDSGGYETIVEIGLGSLPDAYQESGVTIDPFSVATGLVLPSAQVNSVFEENLDSAFYVFDENVIGVNQAFVDQQSFKMGAKRGDPWQQVMAGTGVILGTATSDWDANPYALGDTLTLRDGGSVKVVGILKESALVSAFIAADNFESREQMAFLQTDNPAYAIRVWESSYRTLGAEGTDIDEAIKQEALGERVIQLFLFSFMGLGIVIGMISLGLTTTRNVLMRRHEIGVLRAIGARANEVVTIFSLETAYVTMFSIILGLGGGISMAYAFINGVDEFGYTVHLDWGLMAILYGFTILAAAIATWIPARIASRIQPAEAVRYGE